MPAWPDAPAIVQFLVRATRRIALIGAMRGAAIGLAVSAIVALALSRANARPVATLTVMVVVTGIATLAGYVVSRRRQSSTATLIERRAPACRNILITASELLARPDRVRDYVGARVCQDAADRIRQLDLVALFPIRPAALLVAGGLVLAAGSIALAVRPVVPGLAPIRNVDPSAARLREFEVVVTPPAYTGRPVETARNPTQLTVIEGSRLRVTATADAATVTLDTASGAVAMTTTAAGLFVGEIAIAVDGFLALQPGAPDGRSGERQLVGLVVTPDRPPTVRITAPGRDLFLADGTGVVDVAIEGADDLGLASLTLKYTTASGAGENFEFKDGDVPVILTKKSDQNWTASIKWALSSLALDAGDLVVYRAVASDRRPGAAAVESDAFIIEITAPGAVASEGFAIDDQKDRYALSQQMVILRTEKLIAGRSAMPADAFIEEALNLAAMQRSVRAEFVFMMGGEIEDEEIEAAQEHELTDGRLVNRGRTDLLVAIRSMSRAATALTMQEMTSALREEKQALKSLQEAFTRSRYILRTLTTRERIDFERRLTGVLKNVAGEARPEARGEVPPERQELRRVLNAVTALAGPARLAPAQAADATAAAERLLRLGGGDAALRAVAADLTAAATEIRQGQEPAARGRLERAALALAEIARAALPPAPAATADREAQRLSGALSDAQKRGGGR